MTTLDEVSALARALIDAECEVSKVEQKLKDAKEHARVLREETIPSVMQELGLESLTLDTGQKLKVAQDVYASIPTENKTRAYDWLGENGFGGLIKVNVEVQFSKGEQEKAIELYKKLAEEMPNVTCEQSVHAMTLKAFLKEQLAQGSNIPLDLFGARPVFVAKISTK